MTREWLQLVVHIPFGRYVFSKEYVAGVRTLKKIEIWLEDNYFPRSMFNEYGFPRFPSGNITVTFGRGEAEKAMAYRVFCNEIGLGRTLFQVRIVQGPDPRTTPPWQRAVHF